MSHSGCVYLKVFYVWSYPLFYYYLEHQFTTTTNLIKKVYALIKLRMRSSENHANRAKNRGQIDDVIQKKVYY